MNMALLRLAAVAIAIMAVVDPAVTSSRASRPVVSIVPTSAGEVALSGRVEQAIARRFTVVRGRMDGAAGTVLVGTTLPDEFTSMPGTVVAVSSATTSPSVEIVDVDVPREVSLNARVPVQLRVAVKGTTRQTIEVTLRNAGAIVDTAAASVGGDTTVVAVSLTFVPVAAGPTQLTISARLTVTGSADSGSVVVDARDARYPVLFFDPRASWYSTFVRRAVEEDPRFVVTSRVQTSRGVSNVSGSAPASLRDASLDDYSTIVVGSPDQLSANDVSALDRYMRDLGGSAVLLLDGRVTANVNRLTGVDRWSSARLQNPVVLDDSSGAGPIRARDLAWPATSPAGMSVHAWNRARDSTVRPIVWSVPVGAGRLLASGALDAWHHRDRGASNFDSYWPLLLAGLSAAASRPVAIALGREILQPGQETTVRVTVRGAAIANDRSVSVRAVMTNGSDSSFVRLWPTPEQGTMQGRVVAPASPGPWRLVVRAGSAIESAAFVVDSVGRSAIADEADIISAFVSSRGGFSLDDSQLRELPDRLSAAFRPVSRVETWHPMRSAWWLLPFTALLGAEWWWRRRRGLA